VSRLSARRRHPFAAVVVLFLALLVFGGTYAAVAPASEADIQSASSTQIEEGRALFDTGCASCHGLDGEGEVSEDGTTLGPSLLGVGEASVDFQLGTGRMPLAAPTDQAQEKKPAYNQEQIDAIAAYVGSLAPGPEMPDDEALNTDDLSAGEIARGGELFRTNCASCHNTTGQGGALTYGKEAPNLTDSSARHMYGAMVSGPGAMPVFNNETLPLEDKRQITGFIEQTSNETNPGGIVGIGRIGPVAEGLWAWVIGIGGLIGVAVWITARSK